MQSCKNESWVGIAKYLMHDVSLLLKSVDVTDIQKVLSVIFTSLPPNFGEFIKWVAEVRRREDGISPEEKARVAIKVLQKFQVHLHISLFPLMVGYQLCSLFTLVQGGVKHKICYCRKRY